MRVMRLADSPHGPRLDEEQAPVPTPGPGELLVRVHAAGVTPTELLWYPTSHTKTGEPRKGAVLSHEFSGVIAGLGDAAGEFQIGQEIYGMNDWFAEGALAEYCLTQASSIALKPGRLTHAEAATVPISALTAWQALFDHAHLEPGECVLVHGGSGAVGMFAIQLARLNGAKVVTTVSARNVDFVTRLGAEKAIDYRAGRFEDQVQGVDVVFDTVGGDTLQRSWQVLRPGGRLVTIAADSEGTTDERTKQAFFIVEPNRKQLEEVGTLLDQGRLQTFVDAVLPLAEASAAFTGEVAHRQGRGKLVVVPTAI